MEGLNSGLNGLKAKLSLLCILTGVLYAGVRLAHAQQIAPDTVLAARFLEKADSLQRQAHFDSSDHYLNRARSLFEKAEAWGRVVECLAAAGTNHLERGQLQKAAAAADEGFLAAEKELDPATRQKSLALLHRLRGRVEEARSRYDAALTHYRGALDLLRQLEGPPGKLQASILAYIGSVFNSQGRYEEALKRFREALDLHNQTSQTDPLFTGSLFNSIGIALKNLGDHELALEYYRKSLDIDLQHLGSDHPDVAGDLNNIAIIHYYKGDYQRALENMLEATRTFRRYFGERHPEVGIGYNNISIVYSEMGKLDEAIRYMKKSIAIKEETLGSTSTDVAIGYQNLGALYYDIREYDSAIRYYRKALSLHRKILKGPHPEIANIYSNLGEAFSKKQEYDKALEYLRKDLEINLELLGEEHPFVGDTYNKIGSAYAAQNQFRAALHYFGKAISILAGDNVSEEAVPAVDFNNVTSPVFLLEALESKGKAHRLFYEVNGDPGQLEKALDTYLSASSLINEMQIEFDTRESKLLLGKQVHKLYESGIETSHTLYEKTGNPRYPMYALYFSEQSKARLLVEQLKEMNARKLAGIPDSLIAREDQLRDRITRLHSSIASGMTGDTPVDSANFHALQDSMFTNKRKLRELIRGLEHEFPKYYQLKYRPIRVDPDLIRRDLLNEQHTLIEYFLGEDTLFALIVTRTRVELQKLRAGPDLIADLREFRKAVEEGMSSEFAQLSYDIFRRILQPLLPSIRGNKIEIIPDGILNYLPFETLLTEPPDRSRPGFENLPYLIRDYLVTYAPSVSYLQFWSRYPGSLSHSTPRSFLGFAPVFSGSGKSHGNTPQNSRLTPLPLSGYEIEQIASLLNSRDGNSRLFLRAEATEEAFKNLALDRYSIIHLATHAFAVDDSTWQPGIYFTPGAKGNEDGILRLHEIYNLNLDASVVVISACETGVGELVQGEGVLSLAHAFQYAGARSLVVSLWRVDDRSTSALMVQLYRELLEGESLDRAMRISKLRLLENPRYASPRFWAPFVLIGN